MGGVGGEQFVGQRVGEIVLADERVGQHRAVHPGPSTVDGRRDGQLLVPGHVRDQPGLQRPDRGDRYRCRPVPVHPAGDLDDRVVGQERQVPVVAYVRRVHVPVAGAQRGDQPDGRLRVEGAAALPEQLGFGVQGRVGVHAQ